MSDRVIAAEYCADSGKLATKACELDPRGSRKETGYFVSGTEPTEFCDCHVPVTYDTLNGGVVEACDCPRENCKTIGLIHVVRSFPMEIYVTDAQYVWRQLPPQIMPQTSPSLPFFYGLLKEGEYCGISKTDLQYNRLCRAHFDYRQWKERRDRLSS